MFDIYKLVLDVEFDAEFLKYSVIKLSIIVENDYMEKPKLVYDGFSKKAFDFTLSYVR